MERAIFRDHNNLEEIEVEIWENYAGDFIAANYKTEEIIAEAPSRRQLGFALIDNGYTWVRNIKF